MPTFEPNEPTETLPNKMLYLGHTGAGKTGSCAALAAAGYNVRILDLDKGVQILRDYVRNAERSIYLKAREGLWDAKTAAGTASRLSFVSLDETMVLTGAPGKQKFVPKGDLWSKAMEQLNDWRDGPSRAFGNIGDWGARDVLVLDGLSRLAQAAYNQQLAMSGNIGKFGTVPGDYRPDMYSAQIALERLLLTLFSSAVKCHVVMVCHIAIANNPEGILEGFPQTLGRALAPKIGQYFNHAIMAKDNNGSRVIVTDTKGMVRLKTPAPLRVKAEYPLETGLAEYFRDVAGPASPATP